MPIDANFQQQIKDICGYENILTDRSECWTYGYDNSKKHSCPELVVFPQHHEQVKQCVLLCNQSQIPITTRGRGTGTTGAAVPIKNGMVLSTERMNKILEFDVENRNVLVQPGVLNSELQQHVSNKSLFWPPDPSSADYCSIGGNLACNAAGPRAVKYGTTRENTLMLQAITGEGTAIQTGSATSKGVVGLDLTRLLIGSEGTLAIITEARLKLSPIPEAMSTIRAFYVDSQSAVDAVISILAQPVCPYALEFIDKGSLDLIRKQASIHIDDSANAMLMIEVDGLRESIDISTQAVLSVAKNAGCVDISIANTNEEKQQIWLARKSLSPALRNFAPNKINEDIVVPISKLPELLQQLENLSNKHEIDIFNFGHAGNGNLHVNLLFDAEDKKQQQAADHCLTDVFEIVLGLNGTLSGEHGIGISKLDYVNKEIDPATLAIMHKVKSQFDPNNILNPGKNLP